MEIHTHLHQPRHSELMYHVKGRVLLRNLPSDKKAKKEEIAVFHRKYISETHYEEGEYMYFVNRIDDVEFHEIKETNTSFHNKTKVK